MLSQNHILAVRMVGGFFLLAHVLGFFFFFPIDLASFSTVYAAFVIVALSTFCFLPRSLLRRVRDIVSVIAVATLCITTAKVSTEISLANVGDFAGFGLNAGLVGVLIIMLMEARSPKGKQ